MPLAHRDGRRSEIDEQRAVRAEAARPARGGRAQLSSQQPVARRERGTLALGERGPPPGPPPELRGPGNAALPQADRPPGGQPPAAGPAPRAQVVDGVEGRAELAEHAALGDAPARGEIDGGNAVERYPRHRA